MTIRIIQLSLLLSILIWGTPAVTGQTPANVAPANVQSDEVAKQIGMLRTSVQSLDATLNDIADKLIPVFNKAKDDAAESRGRISSSFTLLTQAEQRAEMLRRQLMELIEKETLYRTRIAQLDEDARPENVEPGSNLPLRRNQSHKCNSRRNRQ